MNGFSDLTLTVLISFGISLTIYFITPRILLRANLHPRSYQNFIPAPRTLDRFFVLLVFAYTVLLSGLYILRHLSINSGADLGLYDQVVWNTLNGRLFENSLLSDAPFYLGKSFSPIIAAFVPLYSVFPNPSVLIFVQVLALASAALPIYWFAREQLGRALGLVIATAYLLSPAVASILHSDFHVIALSTPTLAFAAYFLLHRHYRGFLACLGIALLIREEIGFIVIALGAFIFLFQRARRFGLALCLFGIAWTIFLLGYLIPLFHGSSTFYYFGSGVAADAQTRYAYLGHGLGEVFLTILTRPDIVLQQVLIPAKVEYVLALLVPLAFLPLGAPEIAALMLPTLGYSLLSTFAFQYSIQSFYSAPLVPFLFFAAIRGAQRLLQRGPGSRTLDDHSDMQAFTLKGTLGVLILVSTSISYYLYAPGPLARGFQPDHYVLDTHTDIGNRLMNSVPHDATLVAQTELVPHLSQRQLIYDFPAIPDYRQADYLVGDMDRFWYGFHKSSWDYFLGTGYFAFTAQQDGFIVAQRRSMDHSVMLRYGDQLTLLGYTVLPTGTLQGGTILRPLVSWRLEQAIRERYAVTVQIVDAFGHIWAHEDREPDDGFSPTNQWRTGKPVGDQYTLPLPPTIPGGVYSLAIGQHKINEDDYLNAYDDHSNLIGAMPSMGSVKIEKNKSSISASDLNIEQPLFVDMQELRFLGYDLPQRNISLGQALHLGLYWRARSKPTGNYTIAVQLRDRNGRVVLEQSSPPAKGAYPTTLWDSGEVLLDWHDIDLPNTLADGEYQIFVLLRDEKHNLVLGQAQLSSISFSH